MNSYFLKRFCLNFRWLSLLVFDELSEPLLKESSHLLNKGLSLFLFFFVFFFLNLISICRHPFNKCVRFLNLGRLH